jgi:hypothetical protein
MLAPEMACGVGEKAYNGIAYLDSFDLEICSID